MDSETFDNMLMTAIVLNTLALALPYEGMTASFEEFLRVAEDVFNIIFVLELVIKVIGSDGLMNYLRDPQNRFDFVIVTMSLESESELFAPSS